MRTITVILTLLASVWATSAQEQERKLVDRLLQPNLSLTNAAQDKQFSAPAVSIGKPAPSKTFDPRKNSTAKPFAGERAFASRRFATHDCPSSDVSANTSTRSQVAKTGPAYFASDVYDTRRALESDANLATASFTGNRPFLGRGKSQKALSAQDTPLTIEQVRELLNKNK